MQNEPVTPVLASTLEFDCGSDTFEFYEKYTVVVPSVYLKILFEQLNNVFKLLDKEALITIEKNTAYVYTNNAYIKIDITPIMILPVNTYLVLDKKQIAFLKKVSSEGLGKTGILIERDTIQIDFYIENEKTRELTLETKHTVPNKTISIPKLRNEVSSIVLQMESITPLLKAKKLSKASGYNIYLDKKTYEVLAIGVESSALFQIFNADIKNTDINRDIIVLRVTDLFTVPKTGHFVLKIFKVGTTHYIETSSRVESLTVQYFELAEETEYLNNIPQVTNHKKIWSAETGLISSSSLFI